MANFAPLIHKAGRINERAAGDSVLLTSAEITGALGYTPLQSPLTTRGDLLTQNPSGTHIRLAIGAAARYLRSDATDPVWAVLNASDLAAGTVPTARLGSGTADSTTVLYGNNTWAVPAGGGTITGSGTTGRVAQFTAAGAIGDSNLIGPASNLLTLAASSNGLTLTVPATGTAALLATANIFTAQQAVRVSTNVPALVLRQAAAHTPAQPTIQYQDSTGATIGGIEIDSNANVIISCLSAPIPTGGGNVLLGNNAGVNIDTGVANFALGDASLQSCVTGSNNVAIGPNCLIAATQSNNVAIGTNAGLNITTGSNNTLIGGQAGNGSGTGNRANNTIIGKAAGLSIGTSVTGTVILGYNAGQAALSDELWIENTTDTRPLIKGDFVGDTLTFFATDDATGAVRTQLTLDYASNNTPAVGFGNRLMFALASSTTVSQSAATWDALWATATHASRKARVIGNVYDTAAREWIRGEASGTAAMIGFLGANAVVRQTSGANLTNSVTSGGTDDTITNWTNLSTYSTDAAAIRNACYQLARKLKQVNDSLRTYGLLT